MVSIWVNHRPWKIIVRSTFFDVSQISTRTFILDLSHYVKGSDFIQILNDKFLSKIHGDVIGLSPRSSGEVALLN